MTIRVKVTGESALKRQLLQVGKTRGPEAIAAGAYEGNVEIMRLAKKLIPRDSGAAAASGYTTLPNKRSSGSVIESGFGGKAKDYIVALHERTEVRHQNGRAKFFESAISQRRGRTLATVAKTGRSAFERNRGARKASDIPTDPNRGAI